MRSTGISAFFFAVVLICSVRPSQAQSSPAGGFLSPEALSKVPFTTDPVNSARASSAIQIAPGNFVLRADGRIENLNGLKKPLRIVVRPDRLQKNNCAHIRIVPAPEVDTKMIAPPARTFADNMPRSEGLQACCRDVREGIVPKAVPFGNFGPIGPLGPNLVLPPAGIRP
jgi:hypothetical protein